MVDVTGWFLRALAPWTRLNVSHPWSHNDAYGWWVVAQGHRLRTARPRTALDVGCGAGNLLARLVGVADRVTGLEPDPEMAALATARFRDDQRVRVLQGSFDDRPDGQWDLVSLVAVLHHLPLEATLRSLRSMVKPGGRLAVVGLSRETRRDAVWLLLSVLLNPLVGLLRHPRPDGSVPVGMTAPVTDPVETLAEIRRVADRELPGARIRHGLFFRYTLTWQR